MGDMPALPFGLVHAALPACPKPCSPPPPLPAPDGMDAARALARRPSTFLRTASTAYASVRVRVQLGSGIRDREGSQGVEDLHKQLDPEGCVVRLQWSRGPETTIVGHSVRGANVELQLQYLANTSETSRSPR